MIRSAAPADIPEILRVWNPIIRDSVATFNATEKTVADIETLLAQKKLLSEPFLVAVEEDTLLGFATYGQFRGGVGYRFSVEHTLMVAPEAAGRGIGRKLLGDLEKKAVLAGMHTMMAGVSGENTAAVAFHRALGYQQVALLPQVGYKFGRRFDLILLQKLF
jgi:phosphinothricin acetyltransferase